MSASKEINKPLDIQRIGIIAGAGELPEMLVQGCQQHAIIPYIAGLKGSVDEGLLSAAESDLYRVGAGGSIVKAFKKRDIEHVVMIGAVNRPSMSDIRPDLWSAGHLARIGFKGLGDNDMLSFIAHALEGEGFKIHGIHEFMPELLTPEGAITKQAPSKKQRADIERGIEVAQAIGLVDVGQSVVIYDGLVLGVEAIEGTDQLIERCAKLRRGDKGGILVKLCKPQQDARLDLPSFGLKTIDNLAKHGYEGAAIHAGNSLLINQKLVIDSANTNKLFIYGVAP